MKTKTINKISILAFLTFFLFQANAFASLNYALEAYGVDTIAGYSTIISSSKTYPNSEVIFKVEKPDKSVVIFPATTNSSGVAKSDLYDYHTHKAGRYYVSARGSENANFGSRSYFDVYADDVSTENSAFSANKTIAKSDGQDKVYLNIVLKDKYGNPIKGHLINVISSRTADKVELKSDITDETGAAVMTLSSTEKGLSVISAFDVTEGVTIKQRVEVAFLEVLLQNAGGTFDSWLPVASAAQSGPIDHFEISGLPDSTTINTNISFTVTAKDQNNISVESYTGKIHFSSEGGNGSDVTLPEDYEFKDSDLGAHEFSLGLKFVQAGSYTITATDIDNQSIKGEKAVTVTSTGQSQISTDSPLIETPTAGSYSQDKITVSGKAKASSSLKIFDNDNEIGSTQSGADGKFSFETAALSDGEHKMYVVLMDTNDNVVATSDTVSITIDKTAPVIDEITLEPAGPAKGGSIVNLKVMSNENLQTAAVVFNSDIIELSPSTEQSGAYVGSIQAPAEKGDYAIDVTLVDQLNNEATYEKAATLTVNEAGGTSTGENGTGEQTENNLLPPSQVIGVIAYGSDKKVTLVWSAATDDSTVSHYKINYGLNPNNLDKTVNTIDAATTWYIPNLENGKEYYFAVLAVDDTNTESVSPSQTVSAIPFTLEVQSELPERPESELNGPDNQVLLKGAALEGNVPPEMIKNGPELIWLVLGTGGLSTLIRKIKKSLK